MPGYDLVPYSGGDRALAKADRANRLEQGRAISDGRVAMIREGASFADSARRIDSGFDLTELCFHRTLRLHQKIASVADDDLRELFMVGLEQTFAGALMRVRSYIGG